MTRNSKDRPTKQSRKTSAHICIECTAPCCEDLTMSITRPRNKDDINELKWYLHFDTVKIFIRNRRWYLLIKGKCMYLGRNNLCDIYEKRSDICRIHQPPYCERFGRWYDIMISNPDELDAYLTRGKGN